MSAVPTSAAQTRVHIRWMIRRDMPEVLAIEHASFEYPWCEEEFLRVLRQRNCIGMVAELGERIVGFMIYELHRNKIHVLDFATQPDFRRQGIGRQMVSKLVSKLSSQRRNRIALTLRETNLTSQFFFRMVGFRAVEVLREHYRGHGRGRVHDALPSGRVGPRVGAAGQSHRQAIRHLTANPDSGLPFRKGRRRKQSIPVCGDGPCLFRKSFDITWAPQHHATSEPGRASSLLLDVPPEARCGAPDGSPPAKEMCYCRQGGLRWPVSLFPACKSNRIMPRR